MNAKDYNESITQLFFNGDPLQAMLADGLRQLAELVEEEHELRKLHARLAMPQLTECPCGCGLQGDICQERLLAVYLADQEIPF